MTAFGYDIQINTRERKLIDIKDFKFSSNKITFLFGESGIGKSLLSKAIYGLINPDDLKIVLNNKSYSSYLNSNLLQTIQKNGFFVFQEPSSHLNPLRTLAEQLREGNLSLNNPKDEEKIIRILWQGEDDAFLQKLLDVYPKPYRPSGGEKQRILLAMAFKKILQYIKGPSNSRTALFVFDEPSGSLDNKSRNIFFNLLIRCFKQKPFTALIITHDYSIISEINQNYEDLAAAIEYRELRLLSNYLVLNEFSKNNYLSWVDQQKAEMSATLGSGQELIRVKSGIEVFGKTLSFFKNDNNGPVELTIKRGELIYLKAGSGIGKTTVAKIIMGLLRPERVMFTIGRQFINEKTKTEFWLKNIWGKYATMIFQHADEALNQNTTVLETFKSLSSKHTVDKAKVFRRLLELFEDTLETSFLDKKIKFLSGGQKQRINILRGLVLDTDILIMDEPLNGLDLDSAKKIIEKIKQRQISGKGILLISHNEEIFDKIVKEENVYYLRSK